MSVTGSNIPPDLTRSPVFQRAGTVHAGLARSGSQWSLPLAFVGAAVLGVVTFLSLSGDRQARAQAAPPVTLAAPRILPAPAPAPVITPFVPAPQPMVHAAQTPPGALAPAMIVDFSPAPDATANAVSPGAAAPAGATANSDDKLSPDERFAAARIGSGDLNTAHATTLHNLSRIAPQGTVIPAVLETAINSDLPGFVRAVVSRDVRGFDGSTVLVPRGSKLVGQYRSGIALSQTRAFVVWARILTPDGVSINIDSPATDRLGRGGLEGETDTHFFQRFGSAILLSVMSAGLNALTDHGNNTAIIIGSTQAANQVAGIALQKQIDIPVTISVPQGTPLQVFVTRDLDFSGTAKP